MKYEKIGGEKEKGEKKNSAASWLRPPREEEGEKREKERGGRESGQDQACDQLRSAPTYLISPLIKRGITGNGEKRRRKKKG